MKRLTIIIEQGSAGLWYVGSDELHGLLIAESSLDDAIEKIAPTIRAMRAASQKATVELLSKTKAA